MNDKVAAVLFVGAGLVVAYFVSAPLRKPAADAPLVGTPLRSQIYAEGTVVLSPGAEKNIKRGSVVFLFAKAAGMKGAPLAVKKISDATFPLSFSLSDLDSPIPLEFYEGDLTVTARIDADGAAGPKQPGDREGEVQIKKGESRKVEIKLGSAP